MKQRIFMILALLLLGISPLDGAQLSYANVDARGGSHSRHISEESQIHQVLHLLEQGLQQFDYITLSLISSANPNVPEGELPLGQYQAGFDSLFSAARALEALDIKSVPSQEKVAVIEGLRKLKATLSSGSLQQRADELIGKLEK